MSDESVPSKYQKGKPVVSFDNVHDAEKLHELVTGDSWFLFEKAKLFFNALKEEYSMGELIENPELWPQLEVFQKLAHWFSEIQVTNDGSERGVKDAQDVAFLFRDGGKRENALLVKNEQRRVVPNFDKKNLKCINKV